MGDSKSVQVIGELIGWLQHSKVVMGGGQGGTREGGRVQGAFLSISLVWL